MEQLDERITILFPYMFDYEDYIEGLLKTSPNSVRKINNDGTTSMVSSSTVEDDNKGWNLWMNEE